MTTVATPWAAAAADGTVISVSQLNRDIFSTTAGEGILSEPNGDMDSNNLVTGFTVQPEHVLPGETVRGLANGMCRKRDYMSDICSLDDSDPTAAPHIPVWGCKARIDLAYACSALFFEVVVFRSIWKLVHVDPEETVTDFNVSTRLSVDGTAVPHTLRPHPSTVQAENYPPQAATVGNNLQSAYEQLTADHMHIGHLMTNVAAGRHEVQLELFMESTDGTASGSSPYVFEDMIDVEGAVQNNGAGQGIDVDVHTRISFGCGGAMAYAIL